MEYEDESTRIDNSLRPLKFDPMPGVIKAQQEPETDLFGEPGGQVDSRTIEIIAGAADGVDESEPEIETAPTVVVAQETVTDDPPVAVVEPTEATSNPLQSSVTRIDANSDGGDATTSTTSTQRNLNIKSSSQYRQVDILVRQAYEAYQAGNYELAMQRYNEALRLDSGNRDALLGRAAINVQNGSVDAAIRDYQTLLLMNPKDSLAMSSLLAVASYSPQETESQLKLMIQEEPDSPYLNFALANAYGAQDRWQEAQGYYFKALQHNPKDPNYAYNLAVSLEHIAQPRSAITYYQRALDNIGNGLATFNREVVSQRLEVLGKL
jgi:Flp pilus assembly protein TadD